MAATVVTTNTGQSSGAATSFTITTPSNLSTGDLLIAIISKDDDVPTTGDSAGDFSLLFGRESLNAIYVEVWVRTVDGTEASTYTWEGDNEQYVGSMSHITGVESGKSHTLATAISNITHIGTRGAVIPNTGQSTAPTSPSATSGWDYAFTEYASNEGVWSKQTCVAMVQNSAHWACTVNNGVSLYLPWVPAAGSDLTVGVDIDDYTNGDLQVQTGSETPTSFGITSTGTYSQTTTLASPYAINSCACSVEAATSTTLEANFGITFSGPSSLPTGMNYLVIAGFGVDGDSSPLVLDSNLTSMANLTETGSGGVGLAVGYDYITDQTPISYAHSMDSVDQWLGFAVYILETPEAGTDITATSDSLTLTKQDTTVQANVDTSVTATSDSLSLTKQDTTVQANVDLNVTATSASLSLTKQDTTVQANVDTNVTATTSSLTLTPSDVTVQANVDTNVTATADTLTLTPVDQTVTALADIDITATSAALTLTPSDATVQADVDLNITATSDTLSFATSDATIQADVDTNVTATAAAGEANSCLQSNDLTVSPWFLNGTGIRTLDQVGIQGQANTATLISNTTASARTQVFQNFSGLPADTRTHTARIFLKKDSGNTLYQAVSFQLDTSNRVIETINTDTGAHASFLAVGTTSVEVVDEGDWWAVLISVQNASLTNATVAVDAAYTDTLGGALDTSLTGDCVVGNAELHLGRSIADVKAHPPIYTVGTPVTSSSLALAPKSVAVQADVDTAITATADSLSLTPSDATVQANVDTNVTATADSLALTPSDVTVQVSSGNEVTATAASLTLTPSSTVIQAGALSACQRIDSAGNVRIDSAGNRRVPSDCADATNVTATSDSLTLTPSDVTVQADTDTNITATADALTLTPSDVTVQANVNLDITATADSLTLTPSDVTVQADTDSNITATADSLTLTPVNQAIQAGVDTNVSVQTASLTLTPVDATVKADVDTSVTATADSLTLAPVDAVVQANVDTDVTATSDSLTLAPVNATVQADTDTNVTATSDSLTITKQDQAVQANTDTRVTATADSLTLTPSDAVVQADTDTHVTAGADSLTLTTSNQVVQAGTDINVSAQTALLTLTPVDATVKANVDANVVATTDSLALTPVDQTVEADVDSNITATSDALTLAKQDQSVQADVDSNVTATADVLTLTPVNQVVTRGIDNNVSAGTDSLTLAPVDQTVSASVNTEITATADSLALTPVNQLVGVSEDITATTTSLTLVSSNVTVQANVDSSVVATTVNLTLVPSDQSVEAVVNVNVQAGIDLLTLTPVNPVVQAGQDTEITATAEVLTLTPVNQSVQANVDTDVIATAEILSFAAYSTTVSTANTIIAKPAHLNLNAVNQSVSGYSSHGLLVADIVIYPILNGVVSISPAIDGEDVAYSVIDDAGIYIYSGVSNG